MLTSSSAPGTSEGEVASEAPMGSVELTSSGNQDISEMPMASTSMASRGIVGNSQHGARSSSEAPATSVEPTYHL